jgi:hypothetical protein
MQLYYRYGRKHSFHYEGRGYKFLEYRALCYNFQACYSGPLRARLERILALVASNQMLVIITQYLNITEFKYSFLLGLFSTI